MLNGPGGMDGKQRYVGNLNLSFAYVEGESLLMGLKVGTRWGSPEPALALVVLVALLSCLSCSSGAGVLPLLAAWPACLSHGSSACSTSVAGADLLNGALLCRTAAVWATVDVCMIAVRVSSKARAFRHVSCRTWR